MRNERGSASGKGGESEKPLESVIKDTGEKKISFTALKKFLLSEFGITKRIFDEKFVPALEVRDDMTAGTRKKLIPESGWRGEILSSTDAIISVRVNGKTTAYRISKSTLRQVDWSRVPASVDRSKIQPADLLQYMVEKPSVSVSKVALDTVFDSTRESRKAHGRIMATDDSLLHNQNHDD